MHETRVYCERYCCLQLRSTRISFRLDILLAFLGILLSLFSIGFSLFNRGEQLKEKKRVDQLTFLSMVTPDERKCFIDYARLVNIPESSVMDMASSLTQGVNRFNRGEITNSLSYFQYAINSLPDYPTGYLAEAYVFEKLKNQDSLICYLQKAIEKAESLRPDLKVIFIGEVNTFIVNDKEISDPLPIGTSAWNIDSFIYHCKKKLEIYNINGCEKKKTITNTE